MLGGLSAVTNPVAPLGISTEALAYGPFADFLIPGLVLLIVLGLGNIGTGILTIRRRINVAALRLLLYNNGIAITRSAEGLWQIRFTFK